MANFALNHKCNNYIFFSEGFGAEPTLNSTQGLQLWQQRQYRNVIAGGAVSIYIGELIT